MFTQKFYIFTLITFLGVVLASCQSVTSPPFECTDKIGCVTIAPDEPIKIAGLQALSGGIAVTGNSLSQATELSISQNDQFLNHPLVLQIEDSKCSPEGGANAALKVVADPQIVGIVGTTCSGSGVTASEIMSDAGLVMISSANTSPSLTGIGDTVGENWQPGYFRTAQNDALSGEAAATFAFETLKVTKAAVINAGDAFSKGLTDVFQQRFMELGGEIVLESRVTVEETDPTAVLEAVALAEAELVFSPINSVELLANMVQRAKTIEGLENIMFIDAEVFITEEFTELVAGQEGLNLYSVAVPIDEASDNHEFVQTYVAQYGEPALPAYYILITGDTVDMLLDAIESVAVIEEDGTIHIGRQALRDALYATTDYVGRTGLLICNPFGDCATNTHNIVHLENPEAGLQGWVVVHATAED